MTLQADSLRNTFASTMTSITDCFCMVGEDPNVTFDQLADPHFSPSGGLRKERSFSFLDNALAVALSEKIGPDTSRP